MKSDLQLLLLLPLLFTGIIAVITTINVLRMSRPERLLKPLDSGLDGDALRLRHPLCASADVWASEHGFQRAGAYRFSQVTVLAWEHSTEQRMFSMYTAGTGWFCDFTVTFEDETVLTTSNTRDSFFLPNRPGVYKQAFLNRGYEAIWQIHRETEGYFHETYGWRVAPRSGTFYQSVINSCTRQMKHVRSLPLWPLRSVWWYCVNRFTKPNRPVRELYSIIRR